MIPSVMCDIQPYSQTFSFRWLLAADGGYQALTEAWKLLSSLQQQPISRSLMPLPPPQWKSQMRTVCLPKLWGRSSHDLVKVLGFRVWGLGFGV